MKHLWLLVTLSWFTIGAALPTACGEATKRPRSVLATVPGLEQAVTFAETKIALGDLVRKIAEATGVPVQAAADVADEPVAVIVKEFPARELLEQLADLLDYQWSRRGSEAGEPRIGRGADSGGGRSPGRERGSEGAKERASRAKGPMPNAQRRTPIFEIWQDLASRQREEALRQGVLAAAQKRLREELRRCLQMAALSPEDLTRLADEGERRRQELRKLPPEEFQALQRQPEERAQQRRANLARALSRPVARSLAVLLGRLPAPQWRALDERGELVFSTDPQPGELPLPATTARDLRAAKPALRLSGSAAGTPNRDFAERQRRREQEFQDRWVAATGFRVTVSLDQRPSSQDGALSLTANATPFRTGAPPQAPILGEPIGFSADGDTVSTSTGLFLYSGGVSAGRLAENTPEREAALVKDPVVGVKQLFPPRRPANTPRRFSDWFIRDLGPELARVYDVQVISDAYWPGMASRPPLPPSGSIALYKVLDDRAGGTHRWDLRGRLIRLRSRRWFLERPREVPLRLVRRWRERHDRNGALPLEEYLSMVRTLKEGQLETLGTLVNLQALPRDFDDMDVGCHALRLFAALEPAQRQALLQGAALSFGELSAPQRALLAEGLRTRGRKPDAAALARGSFRMTQESTVRIEEKRGEEVSFRDQPATTAVAPETAPPGMVFPVVRLRFFFESGGEPDVGTLRTVLPLTR